jgi:hypothetical protein
VGGPLLQLELDIPVSRMLFRLLRDFTFLSVGRGWYAAGILVFDPAWFFASHSEECTEDSGMTDA